MKAPRKLKCAFFLLAVIVAFVIFSTVVDYSRAKSDKHPMFSFPTAAFLDGGTKEYVGLGYNIKFNHKRSFRIGDDGFHYDEILFGPEFRHWFLPMKHHNVRTIVWHKGLPDSGNQGTQQAEAGDHIPR